TIRPRPADDPDYFPVPGTPSSPGSWPTRPRPPGSPAGCRPAAWRPPRRRLRPLKRARRAAHERGGQATRPADLAFRGDTAALKQTTWLAIRSYSRGTTPVPGNLPD